MPEPDWNRYEAETGNRSDQEFICKMYADEKVSLSAAALASAVSARSRWLGRFSGAQRRTSAPPTFRRRLLGRFQGVGI